MLVIESILAFLVILLALAPPEFGSGFAAAAEARLVALARRPVISLIVVAMLPVGLRLLCLGVLPVPSPVVHDEFTHILAGDTLARGRVSNPPHPMRAHLESFHIIQEPTYASMEPLGLGIFLAAGQVVAGHRWAGIVLSVALMCGAIYWMLQAWLPPVWALLGGLLAGLQFGVFGYWMNSYWGGAPAALGGALVLGALPRILERARMRDSLWMAIGLVLLANSRMYEGLVVSLPVAVALFIGLFRRNQMLRLAAFVKVLAPITVILAAAAFLMTSYNKRVTGDPWTLPYSLNRHTYAIIPTFLWQNPRSIPSYRHDEMRRFYIDFELASFKAHHTLKGLAAKYLQAFLDLWLFYIGPLLTIPFVLGLIHYRRVRFLLIVFGLLCTSFLLPSAIFLPHYAAPVTGVIVATIMNGMQSIRRWHRNTSKSGLFLTRALFLSLVSVHLVQGLALARGGPMLAPRIWMDGARRFRVREEVVQRLHKLDGLHLVLVRYTPAHYYHEEWVYNGAEIDGAKVVWAHEMDSESHKRLLDYFYDRQAWIVEADEKPPRLHPVSWKPLEEGADPSGGQR